MLHLLRLKDVGIESGNCSGVVIWAGAGESWAWKGHRRPEGSAQGPGGGPGGEGEGLCWTRAVASPRAGTGTPRPPRRPGAGGLSSPRDRRCGPCPGTGGSGRSFVTSAGGHTDAVGLGWQGSGRATRPGVLRAAPQHGSLAHVSYHRPLLCPRGLSVLRDPFPEALGASSGRCHGNHLNSAHTGGLSAALEPEVLLTRVDSRFPGAEVL